MRLIKLWIVAFVSIAGLQAIAEPKELPSFINDSLNQYISQALYDWNIPGVAVGIVKDGQVIFAKGFGMKELGTEKSVDENTLFMIGSNTKAFTGTAMALLEHDKKCALDDKVTSWVPAFKMHDPWVTQHATLTDIMSHRLGFETFQGDFMYFDSDLSDAEMLEKIGAVKPIYDFRTKWGYCNAGFFVAGQAIKSISGETWDVYLREHIFNPLQMNHTFTKVAEIQSNANASKPHSFIDFRLQEIPYGGLDLLGPAASMSCGVTDLTHWTLALLDSGRYQGQTVIPQKVIDRTREPESIIGNGRHMFNQNLFRLYGLGWNLMDYQGLKIVSHTGAVHGFLSSVTLVPEINLGVVVLTNTDQNWFYEALKWEIVDAFMGLPYRGYSQIYNNYFVRNMNREKEEIQSWRDSVAMENIPDAKLKEFVGTYKSPVYGEGIIIKQGNNLVLTLEHHQGLTITLEHMGNNRFLSTYSNPLDGIKVFPFIVSNGEVKSFVLSVNSGLEFTTYEFFKE
jgi:CubicO group peptidase (beta-lactamase class C family)